MCCPCRAHPALGRWHLGHRDRTAQSRLEPPSSSLPLEAFLRMEPLGDSQGDTSQLSHSSCVREQLPDWESARSARGQKEFGGAQAAQPLPWCGSASPAQPHRAGSSSLMEPHTDCEVPDTFSTLVLLKHPPGAPEGASWSCAVTFPSCGIRGSAGSCLCLLSPALSSFSRGRTAICGSRLMALLFCLIRCLLQLLLGWVMDFQPQQLTREREGEHSQPHMCSLSLMTLRHSVFIEPWIKRFKHKISKRSPGPKAPLQSIRDTLAIF